MVERSPDCRRRETHPSGQNALSTRGGAPRLSSAQPEVGIKESGSRLDLREQSVEDRLQISKVRSNMKPQIKMAVWVAFATIALCGGLWAQAAQESDPKARAGKSDLMSRVTIEVSGGEKSTPVENASVYLKYVEEHKLKKDKKVELNVKTNRDGTAHIPETPTGRVLIQVVADGWKTYGRWYDITEAKQTIKVHLEKPPRWY
jgi:hypothetical protein